MEAQEQQNNDAHDSLPDAMTQWLELEYDSLLWQEQERLDVMDMEWEFHEAMANTTTLEVQTESESGSCSICLEDYTVGTIVRQLPCEHQFHDACVSEWIKRPSSRPDCPNCRHKLLPDCICKACSFHTNLCSRTFLLYLLYHNFGHKTDKKCFVQLMSCRMVSECQICCV